MKYNHRMRYTIGGGAVLGIAAAIVLIVHTRGFQYSYSSQISSSQNIAPPTANAIATAGKDVAAQKPPQTSSAAVTHQLVSVVGGQAVDYPGFFAKASIVADGKKYELTPNQLGYFERVNVGPKSVSQVQVAFPQGQKGDAVAIVVEDGGHLNEGQMSSVATLDDQKNIQFKFMTTDSTGIYRIALHNGSDVKVVNFWVGQEPQVRE